MKQIYHKSVLLQESIDALNICPKGIYVDVTFGGGGHSKAILEKLDIDGRLFAFDQDVDALQNGIDDKRFVLISENFRYVSRFLKFYGIEKVDGILADLGVSSHQLDTKNRGFSTRFEADLDMRMDRHSSQVTAQSILNEYSEQALSNVLFFYGELRKAKLMAKAIVAYKKKQRIITTNQLKQALQGFLPKGKEYKILAQVFQSIRIEVNEELKVLKEFLLQIPMILNQNGRLCVISYHSLEDRLVKRFIKYGTFSGNPKKDFYGNIKTPLKIVKGITVPSEEELQRNNRSRSAKLRVAKPYIEL